MPKMHGGWIGNRMLLKHRGSHAVSAREVAWGCYMLTMQGCIVSGKQQMVED